MCLAQGPHNAVTPVRLEPTALRSRVKHSTTEPLIVDNMGNQVIGSEKDRFVYLKLDLFPYPSIKTCVLGA